MYSFFVAHSHCVMSTWVCVQHVTLQLCPVEDFSTVVIEVNQNCVSHSYYSTHIDIV